MSDIENISSDENNIIIERPLAEESPAEESPAEESPAEETPAEETPAEETPAEETPAEETPAEETPVEEMPVEEMPVEETPVEETPAEETPAEETPAEESPAEESPAEETSAEETPAEEMPVEEMPVEEAPVEESPVEEAPADETPAEETPVEEAPAEETPVEETPIEEVPIEETPVEETPIEEVPIEEVPIEEVPLEEAPIEENEADTVMVIESDNSHNEEQDNNKMEAVNVDVIPAPTIDLGDIYPPENITFVVDNPAPITPSLIFIVPYRDRQKQYEFFSNHMKVILEDIPPMSYKILYLHQKDQREFNRGAMKNIGFIAVKSLYPDDYQNITLVFNDIDIMPYTKNFLNYFTVPGTIKHFYGFTFTLGGIVSITAGDFEKINGFPNFWAWGYEDNLLQKRALSAGLVIDRSQYYTILDPNILHFSEGITRNMSRTEFDLYQTNTIEGIDSITNIQKTYDEKTGFVNIDYFYTPRDNDTNTFIKYDLRGGAEPFKNLIKPVSRRKPQMRMML